MRTGDMGQYLAFQNYKRHVSGYWNGASSSVIYFAGLMAGRTRRRRRIGAADSQPRPAASRNYDPV
jgi:hypothetical protein